MSRVRSHTLVSLIKVQAWFFQYGIVLFVCFDLGFQTRNPVIKYRPDASCMSYMEARAEMPGENNSPVPIPRAQRVADRVHLRLAFSPSETRTRSAPIRGLPLNALPTELPGKGQMINAFLALLSRFSKGILEIAL